MKLRKRFENSQESGLIDQLRRALPIRAYPRPPLIAFLAAHGVAVQRAPRLSIVDVFQGGNGLGLMCRLSLHGARDVHTFVAPFSQIAMDRRHPLGKRLARLGTGSFRTTTA
jgi:hypothetical protein